MKIALLTHRSAAAEFLCDRLSAEHEVVAVYLENGTSKFKKAMQQFKRNRRRKGAIFAILRALELPFAAWLDRRYARGMERYFRPKISSGFPKSKTFEVSSVNNPAVVAQIAAHKPDALCVLGTGILRAPAIETAPLGVFNIHTGLLPEYRGAKSEFWALSRGDFARVGVTVHLIDLGVDTGPILKTATQKMLPSDDDVSLRCKNLERGTALLLEALDDAENGKLIGIPQKKSAGAGFSTPTLAAYFALRKYLKFRKKIISEYPAP